MVRVTGQFKDLDDIRNVPISAGGRVIKLGDFTTITRGYEDPPTYTIRHNGQQVLMLGIVMTDDGNIVELGKALETAVGKVQSELPYGVELERVADQPTRRRRIGLGIRALADGSAGDRARRQPASASAGARGSWSGSRCRSCSASSRW